MPNEMIPSRTAASPWPAPGVDRRTARGLANIEHTARMRLASAQATELVRIASVEAEAVVATVKTQEVDRVTREGLSGQAMLRRYSDVLAQNDPFLADELKFFTDMARLGKGEIIADLVTDYCRESRRHG
jgi:hypothetical protein